MIQIRKAVEADIPAISAIYDRILTDCPPIGWQKGVYPTEDTARTALAAGDLFTIEDDGAIVGAGRINQVQVDVYYQTPWEHEAPDEEVMVAHTLVIDPAVHSKGYGSAFIAFYEKYALEHGCKYLRIDTNAINTTARALYKKLGYREAAIIPCVFNGIPNVNLVMLEKYLG